MNWLIGQAALWLFGAVVAGVIAFAVIAIAIRIFRGRAAELKHARECIAEYDRLYDIVMDDPATPPSAKKFMEDFDHGVMHRGAAHFIATSMFRQRAEWLKPAHEPKVLKDMREVGKHRPDLYDAFAKAIANGFMATMLRWFIPARALRIIFIDPQSDPVTPGRAIACGVEGSKHAPLPQAA